MGASTAEICFELTPRIGAGRDVPNGEDVSNFRNNRRCDKLIQKSYQALSLLAYCQVRITFLV